MICSSCTSLSLSHSLTLCCEATNCCSASTRTVLALACVESRFAPTLQASGGLYLAGSAYVVVTRVHNHPHVVRLQFFPESVAATRTLPRVRMSSPRLRSPVRPPLPPLVVPIVLSIFPRCALLSIKHRNCSGKRAAAAVVEQWNRACLMWRVQLSDEIARRNGTHKPLKRRDTVTCCVHQQKSPASSRDCPCSCIPSTYTPHLRSHYLAAPIAWLCSTVTSIIIAFSSNARLKCNS